MNIDIKNLPIKKPCYYSTRTILDIELKTKKCLHCTNCNGYHRTIPKNSICIDGLFWFNCSCDSTLTVFVEDIKNLEKNTGIAK